MRLFLRIPLILLVGQFAAISHLALSDEPVPSADEDSNVAPTIELTIAPAREPRPALKYRLLPAMNERKPGNAAVHYYRAIILYRQRPASREEQNYERYTEWTELPPDKFPKEEAAKWLAERKSVVSEIAKATYKEECDWGLRIQDFRGPELFAIPLPEIQECRELARILRLKARSEIVAGRYDDAFETLRQGYQLAHDTAGSSLIIGGLVGIAIESIMNAELEHLLQRSGENYYWAIAALPKPVADIRSALLLEMNAAFQVFPFLKDAETTERTPEEWRLLIVRALEDLSELGAPAQFKGWQGELAAAGLMTALYPAAKAELLASGMDRERVEAMPVGQVVAIHTARATESIYHEIFKHTFMPYADAMQRLPATLHRLEKDSIRPDAAAFGKTGIPIASLFLPAVNAVMQAEIRATRNLAALQTIEAIRMHAAETGKLPSTLADVSVVPIPVNPATGDSFPYSFDAATDTATLDVPPSEAQRARHEGKHYVIRLRK